MATLLASCATKPAVQTPSTSPPIAAALTHFNVSGGVGIWTDTENISSRMLWQQRANDFTFDLTAPMGMASLSVEQTGNGSTVTRGNAVVAKASDPGVALQQALGLSAPVPVAQIAQWLKGRPGDADSTKFNSEGFLQSLRYTDQSGIRWNARIHKHTEFQGTKVPALITATGGPYNVRIVLNQWQMMGSEKTELAPQQPSQRLVIPTQ